MRSLFIHLIFCLLVSFRVSASVDSIIYHDAKDLAIIGKYHNEPNYHRLPAKYEAVVRKEVWELSNHSAGISVRFRSNASEMHIRWTLSKATYFPHMAWTGIGGLDLYVYENGKWNFVQTARPKGKTSEYLMFENKNGMEREYLLNLPLYDGVESVFIGVNSGATIARPKERYLLDKKPVVYYGSSIAQGASASRPGTAFTNFLARWLDRPFINLGFSGEGTFDESVGLAMCEMDVSLFVIDCNPNSDTSYITERAVKLVRQLKRCRPDLPVLLVENFIYPNHAAMPENTMLIPDGKNYFTHIKMLKLLRVYEQLQTEGVKGLYYHKGRNLIGDDGEGTVDGSHPNELGMWRIASDLLPDLKKILKGAK